MFIFKNVAYLFCYVEKNRIISCKVFKRPSVARLILLILLIHMFNVQFKTFSFNSLMKGIFTNL